MDYHAGGEQIAAYRKQIGEIRERIRAAQAATEPEVVADYEFKTLAGPVRLSALFGRHDDLLVVHNMGRSCPACTMWADGYTGLHPHVTQRAALVVSSPDPPEVQKAFAESRGWKFPMVSHEGTSFAADMGYRGANGGFMPGVSAFRRRGAQIVRVSDTHWGPGDDFCAVYHFFGLLPDGTAGFRPKFSYP